MSTTVTHLTPVGQSAGEGEDAEHDRRDEGDRGLDEVPPVRVQIEHKRLMVVEQLLRVRHEPTVPSPS